MCVCVCVWFSTLFLLKTSFGSNVHWIGYPPESYKHVSLFQIIEKKGNLFKFIFKATSRPRTSCIKGPVSIFPNRPVWNQNWETGRRGLICKAGSFLELSSAIEITFREPNKLPKKTSFTKLCSALRTWWRRKKRSDFCLERSGCSWSWLQWTRRSA